MKIQLRHSLYSLSLAAAVAVNGCSLTPTADVPADLSQPTADSPTVAVSPGSGPETQLKKAPPSTVPSVLGDKLSLRQDNGSERFFQLKPSGAKFIDNANGDLTQLILDENQNVQIRDAQNQTVGYVVAQGETWQIQPPQRSKALFTLEPQADGGFRLERSSGTALYQIRPIDQGYAITAADKQLLYTVTTQNGKTALKNPRGETLFSTQAEMSPIAIATFGFDAITPAQQAALAYAVNLGR